MRNNAEIRPKWFSLADKVLLNLENSECTDFTLNVNEVTEIIKKVAEDLVKKKSAKLRAEFKVNEPKVTIKDGTINVILRVEINSPTKAYLNFSYQFINDSIHEGGLKLQNLKITTQIEGNRFVKSVVVKIFNKMNILCATQEVLDNINQVLIDLFPQEMNKKNIQVRQLQLWILKSEVRARAAKYQF